MPAPEPATAAGRTPIHLLGVPRDLLLDSREHHDEVLREFRLLAVTTGPEGMSPRFVELIDLLGRDYTAPLAQVDHDQGSEHGARTGQVDLDYELSSDAGMTVRGLSALLDEVDALCARGDLITLPRSPDLRAFQHWALGQVEDQLAGRPPRAWTARARTATAQGAPVQGTPESATQGASASPSSSRPPARQSPVL